MGGHACPSCSCSALAVTRGRVVWGRARSGYGRFALFGTIGKVGRGNARPGCSRCALAWTGRRVVWRLPRPSCSRSAIFPSQLTENGYSRGVRVPRTPSLLSRLMQNGYCRGLRVPFARVISEGREGGLGTHTPRL